VRRRVLEVDAQQLLLRAEHAELDRRSIAGSRWNDVWTFASASSARARVPASSAPVTDSNVTGAPSAAALRATFAAPPGRSSLRAIRTTGTGASGEMRSTSPNQ
jgi:hypothetical protein